MHCCAIYIYTHPHIRHPSFLAFLLTYFVELAQQGNFLADNHQPATGIAQYLRQHQNHNIIILYRHTLISLFPVLKCVGGGSCERESISSGEHMNTGTLHGFPSLRERWPTAGPQNRSIHWLGDHLRLHLSAMSLLSPPSGTHPHSQTSFFISPSNCYSHQP